MSTKKLELNSMEVNFYLKVKKYIRKREKYLTRRIWIGYLQLLEKFVEKKIDIGEFCIPFEERAKLSGEVTDILESNLILLSPHPKSLDFSDFIGDILDECEIYNPDPEPFRHEYEQTRIRTRRD